MASIGSYRFKTPQDALQDVDNQFQLDQATLTDLVKAFLAEFKNGLSSYGHSMAMIPTYVTGVPDGSETGTFLALDLGGTNLRVCEVELHGDKTFSLRQQKYKVSDALKTGEASVLFDYLADSVDAFLTSSYESPTNVAPPETPMTATLTPDVVHLGLTFSFPVEQTALDSGKILTWTKGFSAKHAIGNDVVKLLQDAFDRKHMHVKCVALVNDTVGALLSRSYTSGGCFFGSIFGTGTNGAYVEQVANITKLGNDSAVAKGGPMIVNTEWGAFDNTRKYLPSTPFDNVLDRQSINPRFQAFEKFISGMYLGEISRIVILSLIDASPKPLLFNGKTTSILNSQWGVDTSLMSDVETAWEGKEMIPDDNEIPVWDTYEDASLSAADKEKLDRVRKQISEQLRFELKDVSRRDAAIVRWIFSLVARRAALLSGVAVAAVLVQTGRGALSDADGVFPKPAVQEERFSVGVDGSLIQFYPHFEKTTREAVHILLGEDVEKKLLIGLAKDGSGVGAALCALQAVKDI